MRLKSVYVDGFKNLNKLHIDFNSDRLTTVLIGQNGAGKSNLIEAITHIFRWVDMRRHEPRFHYRISYLIQPSNSVEAPVSEVTLSNLFDEAPISVDGKEVKRAEFDKRKIEWFPDLVFGYYSGGSRRLEGLFDSHQRRYYDAIKRENSISVFRKAQEARRLFYCRPIHGVLALIALFSFPDPKVTNQLSTRLGITGFHSMLAHFREPWFARGKKEKPENFWGASGPAGRMARRFQEVAFHPFALEGNAIDDYRDKLQTESQYATFLPSLKHLQDFSRAFSGEREIFYALEAMDISDVIREMLVWVTRTEDQTGEIGFADLSDGERQLLMVLGLIRVSSGKRVLFLLDEPDTHLNPHWQHSYLKLIEDWTGITANVDKCHIVLTSHNPLTISALTREEVRIMYSDPIAETVAVEAPFVDPQGLGIGGVLTDIFGMRTTLDRPTQELIDARNKLARSSNLSESDALILEEINDKLRELGFMYDERDELFREFLRKIDDVELAEIKPQSPYEVKRRDELIRDVIEKLLREK